MMEKKTILISGAGLVGSMLAIALKQKGHDVCIFEKRKDLRASKESAGKSINLIITAKGIKALRDAEIYDVVEKITTPVYGRMMHSLEGELTYQPYGRDDSEYNLSVSRGELNCLLMDKAQELGVKIKFQESLESIDFEAKKASFTSISEASYDLFFGADGAGSQTREELKRVYGAGMNDTMTSLGVKYKELYMPAAKDGGYPMDKKCLHIWPRGEHMLMALPNTDGSFTMTVYLPDAMMESTDTLDKADTYFKEYYTDSIEFMPDYAEQFIENPAGFLGVLKCHPWVYEDSVCLLGDAAHAIVPFFGQGMNTGFSDVSFLISAFDRHPNNISLAFKEYNDFQKLNGDAIADLSVENYQIMSAKVADEKYLLRKKIEHQLENTFPHKYRSRYGMVTYTLMPYHHAKAAGEVQNEILEQLVSDISDASELNLKRAEELIDAKLIPFMNQHQLDIARYQ